MEWIKCLLASALLIGSIVFLASENTSAQEMTVTSDRIIVKSEETKEVSLQDLKLDVARLKNLLSKVPAWQAELAQKEELVAQIEAKKAQEDAEREKNITPDEQQAIDKLNLALNPAPVVNIPDSIEPSSPVPADIKDADVVSDNEVS